MFDPTVSCPANSHYVGNSQGEVGNYQCICNNGYVAVRNRTACEQCPTGLTLNSLTYDAGTDANRYYTNCSGCTIGQFWKRVSNSCGSTISNNTGRLN